MPVDIMIVGATKSGTSTLLAYLGQHTRIQRQEPREMMWFKKASLPSEPFDESLYFTSPRHDRLRLGKLALLMYHDEYVDRLKTLNPNVQTIAILRDPVARAYSAFSMGRRLGREPVPDFGDALRAAADDHGPDSLRFQYLEAGRYSAGIERLQERMPPGSVHVIILEEFLADAKAAVAALANRLNLNVEGFGDEIPHENAARSARSPDAARVRKMQTIRRARGALPAPVRGALGGLYRRMNLSETRLGPMDPATERELCDYFSESNRQLEELLGRPIEAWHRTDG